MENRFAVSALQSGMRKVFARNFWEIEVHSDTPIAQFIRSWILKKGSEKNIDNILAMRFIEACAGAIVAKEIAAVLLKKFKDDVSLLSIKFAIQSSQICDKFEVINLKDNFSW